MYRGISDFLKMNDVEFKEKFSLSKISPIRIGSKAEFVVYPKNEEQLIGVVNFAKSEKKQYKIVGRMSNILPPDDEFEGVIIKTDRLSNLSVNQSKIQANAGTSIFMIAQYAAKAGLSGMEQISGIPGSIGGAICGNAGAFGREIAELISSVTVYNLKTSGIEQMTAKELGFGYRTSVFMDKSLVILSATLSLCPSNSTDINRLTAFYRDKRVSTQPIGEPSLGSVFKRPSKDVYAGKLIDECGLKGRRVGGAQISNKHAGFIVNIGGATASDYLELVNVARDAVYNKFGILLEREIEVI